MPTKTSAPGASLKLSCDQVPKPDRGKRLALVSKTKNASGASITVSPCVPSAIRHVSAGCNTMALAHMPPRSCNECLAQRASASYADSEPAASMHGMQESSLAAEFLHSREARVLAIKGLKFL